MPDQAGKCSTLGQSGRSGKADQAGPNRKAKHAKLAGKCRTQGHSGKRHLAEKSRQKYTGLIWKVKQAGKSWKQSHVDRLEKKKKG